jgi:hypothetical protein
METLPPRQALQCWMDWALMETALTQRTNTFCSMTFPGEARCSPP